MSKPSTDGLPEMAYRHTDETGQKGQVRKMEEMNRNELQKLLDEEAREGKSEIEAYRKAMRIIGVAWRQELEKKKDPSPPTKQ